MIHWTLACIVKFILGKCRNADTKCKYSILGEPTGEDVKNTTSQSTGRNIHYIYFESESH